MFEILPTSDGKISITNEQVYTFVLSNHNGNSFQANEDLTLNSVTQYNNSNNATIGVKTAKDAGRVSALNVTTLGSGYEGATITVESPQLPGGSNATGSVKVSNGQLYLAEVAISGRGYTEAPAVVVRGSGSAATGAVIESEIIIDEPAVRMGIAVDTDTTVNSTIPTRFNFNYPVYLQDNTDYALNIECDTTEYEIWSSRLGETDISSGLVVNTQPLLGSVFKSQNVDNWTEDLFEDIKFTLYRAEFDISRTAELLLTNEELGYEKLAVDPAETYALANSTATSALFKNNSNIVKINHRDNGFETDGNSKVYFKGIESFAGYEVSDIENTLYTVANSGIDTYTVVGPARASTTGFGGGTNVLASYNRKYEKLYAQVPYLQTSNTKIDSYVTTTDIIPVDSSTTNYSSYSQSPKETTFLNEEQFFLNQKVIASGINEIVNGIDNSLVYKIDLSSTKSHLSPLIDLRTSSVKLGSNRVENTTGTENRYGKRYQIIKLYPVYKFTVSGNGSTVITTGQNVSGIGFLDANTGELINASGASSEVLRVVNNDVYVKVKNSLQFEVGETLTFSVQSVSGGNLSGDTVVISTAGIFEQVPNFVTGSTVTAYNPSNLSEKYDNKVSGKVIIWDSKTKSLTIENDKNPINSNYISPITAGSDYARTASTSDQINDIFREGELIDFEGSTLDTSKFAEVKSMAYDNGVDYVPEDGSLNTSGVSKYVTKEIFIDTPATAVNVYVTANVKDIEDVKILYKTKLLASQENFNDIDWEYFNVDGGPDNKDIIATSENSISGQYEKQSSYQELRYTIDNLKDFSSFAIKIVMKTSDPSYVPKIQDMRAVASY